MVRSLDRKVPHVYGHCRARDKKAIPGPGNCGLCTASRNSGEGKILVSVVALQALYQCVQTRVDAVQPV